jgi:hypothetical protein
MSKRRPVIERQRRPPLRTVLKSLVFLLRVKISGPTRIRHLLQKVGESTQFSERGILRARKELDLGRLYLLQGHFLLPKTIWRELKLNLVPGITIG